MSVYRVIDKLEASVKQGTVLPLGYRIVSEEKILELIEKLRASLPEEVGRARTIAKNGDRLVREAQEKAQAIVVEASSQSSQLIDDHYPPEEWNIYPFHFSDGDNWSVDDTHTCVELLKKDVLPYVNLFSYGQVESPYGSGQFIKDLTEHFDEDERVVTSEIKGKETIMDSIKEFLGKGR